MAVKSIAWKKSNWWTKEVALEILKEWGLVNGLVVV